MVSRHSPPPPPPPGDIGNPFKRTPVVISSDRTLEEEELPGYDPRTYYPVYIGEVFISRYKVITKLGFGVSSTVWMVEDLKEGGYRTLKLRTLPFQGGPLEDDREIVVSRHVESSPSAKEYGRDKIRLVLDHFEVPGPYGMHTCLIYRPLLLSLNEFRRLLPGHRVPQAIVRRTMQLLLIGLEYLHKCQIVHTDLSPNNVLFSVKDESVLAQVAREEDETPCARIHRPGRIIYTSRLMPFGIGDCEPVIVDLGEARIGPHKHTGRIMPRIMRAPEVILGMEWDFKVDVWAAGLMTWHLIQGRPLFSANEEGLQGDECHLAEMIGLIGNPPKDFLRRSEKCSRFWDSEGNWRGSVPIPTESFESKETALDNTSKALFAEFLRSTLHWVPEERPTAFEVALDEFLMRGMDLQLLQS